MTEISYTGRVALVTGAARGLGRAYCLALAARGAHVIVNDLDADACESVAEEIRAAAGEATAASADVATEAGGRAAVAAAHSRHGRLDILISNAGVLLTRRFEESALADVERVMRVNLMAGFYVGQPAFELMKAGGYGRIVLVGSSSAIYGHPWHSAYGAAKAGLLGLSNILSLEGRRHGITCNLLLPTAITAMNAEMGQEWIEDEGIGETVGQIDFEQAGERMTPAHNTPLLLYLASEQNTSTHGVYSSVAGRYARVRIAVNEGWNSPAGSIATPEDVMAHWSSIQDSAIAAEPMHVYEELLTVQSRQP